ncbi:MAG: fumarylacetoacetate hydrolase family protein [Candidatus Aminicenantes bacterium]|nr:fumarylacetoacetate hydrolase family protein [Candidatus Aminicenantes bacterium]
MKYFRYRNAQGDAHLIVQDETGGLFDLTRDAPVEGFTDLVRWARLMGQSVDGLVGNLLRNGDRRVSSAELIGQGLQLGRPLVPPEVWAAGVTYRKSRDERERESETPDPYAKVYRAERPEIFLKATPARCVGPGEAVGVRGDSGWDVPEAELAFILHDGRITGFTAGNDVSSRSIEGANPLYLPQAKIYRRCCSIGPCIVSAGSVADPHNLAVSCEIFRDGDRVFSGETSTSRMVRTCEELAGFLTRHNTVPDGTVVLTGTGIVPHQEFSLQPGDRVRIEIEDIGILENPVVQV